MANYVNNAQMLQSIVEYREKLEKARADGTPEPRVPEYLGDCILKIATHLARKANFTNYSYKSELISDGIENAIRVVNSFDPNKSSNPFSYFTQVIYFAFLRRIASEKKQSYVKAKLIQNMPFDSFEIQEHDDDADFKNAYTAFIQSHQNFDDSFLKKKEKKKSDKKDHSLESFFEEEITGDNAEFDPELELEEHEPTEDEVLEIKELAVEIEEEIIEE